MSTDINTRRDEIEGRFVRFGLIAAALIYAVLLCLSYL